MHGQDSNMPDDIYNPAFVAALFDRCAVHYHRWTDVYSFGLTWLLRRQCVDRLSGQSQIARIRNNQISNHTTKCPQIFDIMSGTGEVWPHIYNAFPCARITAIDISTTMHNMALTHLNQTQSQKISCINANFLENEQLNQSADMIVATFGLKTFSLSQQTELAAQIARTLRDGGCFSLIEISTPKGWLLGSLTNTYLMRVLPMLENVFSHGSRDFSMIGQYTLNFIDCSHMATALRAEGLNVTFKRHFFGCATSVAGTKPIALDASDP